MFYERVFKILSEKKVRYAVAGGVALVLHGVVRFTADIDLILALEEKNLENFISAIKELGFKPRIPVKLEDFLNPELRLQWYEEKNMIFFTFYNPSYPLEEIDVFVRELIPFSEIEKEIEKIPFRGITIPVISKKHLKKLKEKSGRQQDLADIFALEEIEKIKEEQN